ncbi:hypothetical protein [Methylibium sp.]|uniref:hypothetical protein n=1 Tax=Methylibium sp. TaxID=2067992 RepID=UPI003BA8518B
MSAQHTPAAMLAAFRRIPLGTTQDKRKLKRWVNTVWNCSRALRAAGQCHETPKPTHSCKMRALRDAVKVYRAAATGSPS